MNDMRERLVELIENAEDQRVCMISCCTVDEFIDIPIREEYVADYLIANGVTVQEWISVEDRLPDDENHRVLAACVGDYPIGYPRIDTDRYTRGHWVRYGNDVTHWMPLPQPPKGE